MGRLTTTERGYGFDHQKLRRQLLPLVLAGRERCVRCGELIDPRRCTKCAKPLRANGKAGNGYCGWDVAHRDGSREYAGLRPVEHACCNRATQRHKKLRRAAMSVTNRVSRGW